MEFRRDMLLLYAVTDRGGRRPLYEGIEEALRGGATMVQLREKHLSAEELTAEAAEVKALCRRYGVPLIVNDSVQAALDSGADGVHVGAEDAPVSEIRKKAPAGFIIGATAKTPEQARRAEAAGADYLGVGAVFPSPTKRGAVRITTQQLRAVCSAVSIPAVAIGGITLDNVQSLRGSGIFGIAVVSALFGAADVRRAAEELRKRAEAIV